MCEAVSCSHAHVLLCLDEIKFDLDFCVCLSVHRIMVFFFSLSIFLLSYTLCVNAITVVSPIAQHRLAENGIFSFPIHDKK